MNGNSRNRQIVEESHFIECVTSLVEELLSLADLLTGSYSPGSIISRPFLGRYFGCATRLEEILDSFGAKNNSKYQTLRHCVAAAKQFSRVGYALLHVRYTSPAYYLLQIDGNFPEATENAVHTICETVFATAQCYKKNAIELGFKLMPYEDTAILNPEILPGGLLPADREIKETDESDNIVVLLASAFLNQSEEERLLHDFSHVKKNKYGEAIPGTVNENRLRIVQNRFHNLQSLYDTHLSDSNLELIDASLPVLRGHISIIYHLTEIATVLCHFYERHLSKTGERLAPNGNGNVVYMDADKILTLLMDYTLSFSYQYLKAAQAFCRSMIQKYTRQGEVELPVPPYRGFHVRPSTLISKIVLHYGARVRLILDNSEYDASVPLDLFRVNEKINAIKRKKLAHELEELPVFSEMESIQDRDQALRVVFFGLLETGKIVLYEGSITFSDLPALEGETLGEYARRGVARFLALGKIDILTDTKVRFVGDVRALEDIRLLAESGYGEDKFGNDIVLPEELSYLRK